MPYKNLTLAALSGAILIAASPTADALIIDNFRATTASQAGANQLSVTGSGGQVDGALVTGHVMEVIGPERDTYAEVFNPNISVANDISQSFSQLGGSPTWEIGSSHRTTGKVTIQYDGSDAFSPARGPGLGGIDLAAAGDSFGFFLSGNDNSSAVRTLEITLVDGGGQEAAASTILPFQFTTGATAINIGFAAFEANNGAFDITDIEIIEVSILADSPSKFSTRFSQGISIIGNAYTPTNVIGVIPAPGLFAVPALAFAGLIAARRRGFS